MIEMPEGPPAEAIGVAVPEQAPTGEGVNPITEIYKGLPAEAIGAVVPEQAATTSLLRGSRKLRDRPCVLGKYCGGVSSGPSKYEFVRPPINNIPETFCALRAPAGGMPVRVGNAEFH